MGIFFELRIHIRRQFFPDATPLTAEIGLHLFKKLIGLEDFEFTQRIVPSAVLPVCVPVSAFS